MKNELQKLLGDSAKGLLEHKCKTVPADKLHLPGPDFVDRVFIPTDRTPQVLRSLNRFSAMAGWRERVFLDFAGGSGNRTFGRREFRAEPGIFRPGKHRQARDRRRMQCGGFHAGFARHRGPQIRPSDSFSGEIESQRADTYPNTFDQIYFGQVEQAWNMGATAIGATIYYRLAGEPSSDHRDEPGFPARARTGHGHSAVVLPSQPGV